MTYRAYFIWFIPCLFVAIQFFLQNVANVFAGAWIHDFHLTPVSLAHLSSAYYYTYALLQIPAGFCFDRFSARHLLTFGLTLVALSCFLLAGSEHMASAFFARLLMGAACSFAFVGMLKMTTQLFSARQFPLMIGISETFTMASVSLALSLCAYWILTHNWQSVQILVGFSALGLAVLCYFCAGSLKQLQIDSSAKVMTKRTNFAFLYRGNVLIGSLYCLLAFTLISAFTSLWGVQFLMHTQGLSSNQAANINAVILVGVAIGSLGWAFLAKWLGYYVRLLQISTVISFIVLMGLLFATKQAYGILVLAYFIAGVCSAAYIPCLALIKESVTTKEQATSMAFANMMIMIGAPGFQLLMAYMLMHPWFNILPESAASYQFAMSLLPLSILAAFVLTFYLREEVNPNLVLEEGGEFAGEAGV